LRHAYAPFPAEYLFPAHGSIPLIAHGDQKSEAALPYWSTLGKAEMLRASMALDQALAATDDATHEARIHEAVKHITLSLGYDGLVANEYFELTRAEEWLHKRVLHDSLSIRMLHKYAQEIAQEHGLQQPTRFQEFLNRMFGPMDLWA
jgi:hypothetical protein